MKRNEAVSAILVALLFAAYGGTAVGAGDPKRGARVFQACMACHSIKPGEHTSGPSLADMWERKAGTAEGFLRYSDTLKHSDIVWTESTLDKWLVNPERFIPGNNMTFPGLRGSNDRRDVIAYLKAVSQGKAPVAEQQRGGMMMMRSAKINLKQAPAAGQVAAISHCGDTYTVTTADGKKQKVWEFNLRFKTDSSKDGPSPGKPVIVGAGMQGDRASVVFAAPGEISSFIKQSCQ